MKNWLLISAILFATSMFAQDRKSPHDTVSYKDITVTYGRPYKNNRVIFGVLEKYGKVWRLGADEATTITFKNKVQFGDAQVPAGTYTMFALVNEKEWTLILNGVLGQWGAFSYEENKAQNVARVNVPVSHLDAPVDQLIIRFDEQNNMFIEWDVVSVMIPIKPGA